MEKWKDLWLRENEEKVKKCTIIKSAYIYKSYIKPGILPSKSLIKQKKIKMSDISALNDILLYLSD